MYKKCKTLKTVQRQKEFEVTFLSMMERMAYKDISISGLCREMNIQRKTFYRYFDGIEDVLNAILDEVLKETFICLWGKPDVESYFRAWKDKKDLLDILEMHDLSDCLMRQIWKINLENKKGNLLMEKDISHIAGAFGFLAIVMAWHHDGMSQSIEELVKISRRMYKLE